MTAAQYEEPWDESMGPPPVPKSLGAATSTESNHHSETMDLLDSDPTTHVRSNSYAVGGTSASPPSAAFTRSNSTGNAATTGPPANAFHTNHRSTSLGSGSNFADDDMRNNNDNGSGSDNDDKSVDSEIGRAYDVDHDNIRQEALRMLEVADADKHYSVHRTVTGGFTAQAKSLGERKPGRAALAGLNFVATRKNVGKRYSDYATTSNVDNTDRDDSEYGENRSVVDVAGLQERSASQTSPDTNSKGTWSSRYSIDNTLLAMSGGATSMRIDANERFASNNLFHNSPAKSTGIFGSGFSFRQNYVYGKQDVVAKNLHTTSFEQSPNSDNDTPKTWQEQLLQKRRQQRLYVLGALLFLVILIFTITSVVRGANKRSSSSSMFLEDGIDGTISFHVTGNGPSGQEQLQAFRHNAAVAAPTTRFTVHLGNIQIAAQNQCAYTHYQEAAYVLEESSPNTVFVVPGQEDWNNCPNPDYSWDLWYQNFHFFDKRWDDTPQAGMFTVLRQKNQLENWAFVTDGVLFLGIHVVNGRVPDQTEFDSRNKYNYDWVKGMSEDHYDEIRAVVVFGNARPGYQENAAFFGHIEQFWKDFDKPVMYIHAIDTIMDTTTTTGTYDPFLDLPHVYALQVDTPTEGQPTRVNVNYDKKDPFRIG